MAFSPICNTMPGSCAASASRQCRLLNGSTQRVTLKIKCNHLNLSVNVQLLACFWSKYRSLSLSRARAYILISQCLCVHVYASAVFWCRFVATIWIAMFICMIIEQRSRTTKYQLAARSVCAQIRDGQFNFLFLCALKINWVWWWFTYENVNNYSIVRADQSVRSPNFFLSWMERAHQAVRMPYCRFILERNDGKGNRSVLRKQMKKSSKNRHHVEKSSLSMHPIQLNWMHRCHFLLHCIVVYLHSSVSFLLSLIAAY